jgi:hypothetical protein
MSLKDLFKEDKNLKSFEPLSKSDFDTEIESFDYADAVRKRDERYLATEKFYNPVNFARFGSAEKYYEDSIKRIYNTYPYDGSLKEKVLWEVSSSLLDLYLFENGYPRTTGYANFLTSVATSGNDGNFYPPSGDDEYILAIGGPHAGQGNSLYYDPIQKEMVYRQDANVWDTDNNRENNLKIGGTDGNTVEFWLKKDAYVADQNYFEFICDAHVTGTVSGSTDFGRLTIALATTGTVSNTDDQPILVRYASGSGPTGKEITQYLGSSTLTTASIADGNWHHYAVRMKTTGSNTVFDLFVDGQHNDEVSRTGTISYVSGAIVATIGAQAASFDVGGSANGERGWSKFSGSLDELRYWKTWRTSKQIQRYWFDQVGGGTNTDLSNTDLGVYYKFNEGIVGDAATDSIVLDYSGRVSNGTWTGYGSSSRTIGSAITDSNSSKFEFNDPIIYSTHSDVSTYLANMKGSGSVHDKTNANSMLSYIPNWIIQENETDHDLADKNHLLNLLQIISSYFDEASTLLQKLPQLTHKKYYTSGSSPPPFNKFALESAGFAVPDIFINSTLLEKFENRDDEIKFETSLQEVKNIIYQNIYNNLDFIYKSKGTEKAFRNLFHCFGFGDDTLKFNIYANNSNYKLEENLKFVTKAKNYINFNDVENADASVYQYQIDSNSTSYISASQDFTSGEETEGLAFTLESNVLLPNRVSIDSYSTVKKGYENKIANIYPLITDSSLFGVHAARETENELTWPTNDYANFQVLTVKDDKFSSNAYFKLTSTTGGFVPLLTSSIFEDVYDDQLWTIAVTVKPGDYPQASEVDGTTDEEDLYTVQFYGVNHMADYKAQSFSVSGTMTREEGKKFLASHKRVYVGAHRTNFTGSLLHSSDIKVNSCKAWMKDISTDTLDLHNKKIGNYGSDSPTRNAFLYQDSINDLNVPENETLALLWDFSQVTASNAVGQFSVEDETSGSADENRYGWFSGVVSRRHTASGSFFDTTSTNVVESLERSTYQSQVPEVLNDSNLVRVLSQDDEFFNRNTRPTTYHMSIEKNMFQDISEDMLNMFGSAVYFNNLIGDPVNKYRGEYKELKKAADLYFEKVDNDYDFDKYIEYFKFIDYAVSRYIAKLIPASMNTFKDGISTIVENFALGDRSKYQTKFPIVKDVKPQKIEALIIGGGMYDGAGNLIGYNQMYAPLPESPLDEAKNVIWWKERAEKTQTEISSSNAFVNADKQQIQNVINNLTNFPATTLSGAEGTYEASTYVLRKQGKPVRYNVEEAEIYHGGTNFNKGRRIDYWSNGYRTDLLAATYASIGADDYIATASNDDITKPNQKVFRHYYFDNDGIRSNITSPFNIISSSLDTVGVYGTDSNLQIVNLHYDTYGDSAATPLQGPFTDAHVGGHQRSHITFNTGSDTITNRPEHFRLVPHVTSDTLYIYGADQSDAGTLDVDLPRADFLRDGTSKRPVNIANIQSLTGTRILGNYNQDYDIVMTNGRSINNKFMVRSEGDIVTSSADSYYLSGVVDFALPQRNLTGSNQYIIVNRFSAPGGPATMAEGMLDVTSGEYSVYNALPWRNLSVITPMNELLSDHCKQFGYFSDAFDSASYVLAGETYVGSSGSVSALNYEGSASFHKVNRNTRKVLQYTDELAGVSGTVITASFHDNAFVTHLIPQSDMQYAWITASAEDVILGYETRDLDRKDYASSDVQFITSSIVVSVPYGPAASTSRYFGVDLDSGFPFSPTLSEFNPPLTGAIPTDFANLNTNIYEPVTSSTNTLGYPASLWDGAHSTYVNNTAWTPGAGTGPYQYVPWAQNNATVLNSILLNRQGPYGDANWKLYKKDAHPIVRYQRNNNIIGTSVGKAVGISSFGAGLLPTFNVAKDYEILNFTEPVITSKFKPLIYSLSSSEGKGVENVVSSLGNLQGHFTNHTQGPDKKDLNILLPTGKSRDNIKKITYSPYSSFKLYIEKYNNKEDVQVVYSETIYPKEQYTYLSGTRKRINFLNDFWRFDRDDRTSLSYDNSAANSIDIASIWKLDSHIDYTEEWTSVPFSGGMTTEDGVGELQNCYSLFHYAESAGGGSRNDIIPAVNYNRRTKLIYPSRHNLALTTPTYFHSASSIITASQMPKFYDLTDAPSPSRYSASVGDNLFEVTTSAGEKPFYDSYEEYAEEGFRNMKDGTILPEYRISEKIDNFISLGTNLEYNSYTALSFFDKEKIDGNTLRIDTGAISLTGSQIASTDIANFLERHVFSDFYEYFNFVETDYTHNSPQLKGNNKVTGQLTKHKLACEAILKFLPYDGFYPAERTVQLGTLFSQSLNNVVLTGDDANFRTLMQPYFAPGILYNSIKSGIAVDYPIAATAGAHYQTSSLIWGTCITGNFDYRLNIDSLIEPNYKSQDASANARGIVPDVALIFDSEKDPDLNLDSTGSYKGNLDSQYTFAMSNFLAATMDTFIGKNYYSSIDSAWFDEEEPIVPTQDGTYTMDIVLRNSTNIDTDTEFETVKNDQHYGTIFTTGQTYPNSITSSLQINTSSITMYDRAITGYNTDPFLYGSSFGPPVHCGEFAQLVYVAPGDPGTSHYTTASGQPHGTSFDPYTPSYYNGYSRARISVTLEANQYYDLPQIVSLMSHSYSRMNTFMYPAYPQSIGSGLTASSYQAHNEAFHTTAYRHSMQLSASMFLGDANPNQIIFEKEMNKVLQSSEKIKRQTVSFRPRFECPVLDFENTTPALPYISGGNVRAKGMWHQYGELVTGQGIQLEVKEPDDTKLSLAKLLKINTKASQRIGKLEGDNDASFSEAIIAIPFRYDNLKKETALYNVDTELTKNIKDNLYFDPSRSLDPFSPIASFEEVKKANKDKKTDKELYDLFMMMRKYVIPPHLDFLHNKNTNPFVMFMMEFEMELNQTDLQNVWQNIEPTFAKKAIRVKTETNSHSLPGNAIQGAMASNNKDPFFAADIFKSQDTRWAVFKVKRRAKTNFNAAVGKTKHDFVRRDLSDSNQTDEFLYSYNWPHDFYSLIELAKVDSITTFNPIYSEEKDKT